MSVQDAERKTLCVNQFFARARAKFAERPIFLVLCCCQESIQRTTIKAARLADFRQASLAGDLCRGRDCDGAGIAADSGDPGNSFSRKEDDVSE